MRYFPIWQLRRCRRRSRVRDLVESVEVLEDRTLLAIEFVFDYSLDSSGFFSNSNRKAALERAAATLETRINDTLEAITPSGNNTWSAGFTHPGTGASETKQNLSIGRNKLLVFAGGRNLAGTEVGRASIGFWSWSGTREWGTTVETRGQPGVLDDTDFVAWGGAITFDASTTWHFDADTSGLDNTKLDFLSIATHELAHLLGFGTAPSWKNKVNRSSQFTGASARAVHGGPVPLTSEGSHWSSDVRSGGLETAMAPALTTGIRKIFTSLDWAGLQDVGLQVTVPPSLSMSVQPSTLTEGDGTQAATGTISRSGSTSNALTVNLTNSDVSEVRIPARVTIPAGSARTTFDIEAVDDAEFDGTQTVTIVAQSSGAVNQPEATLTVRDNEVPALTLQLARAAVLETDGEAATTGTVSRNGPTTDAVTVKLTSSDRSEITVPANVAIPAGQASATFDVAAVDDNAVDGRQSVTLTATAADTTGPAEATIDVLDNEQPSLSVTVVRRTLNEHDGAEATTATISRNGPTTAAVSVRLVSGDTSLLTVPATVLIPAGSIASDPFGIGVVDDRILDGDMKVTLTAQANGALDGTATINIVDNERPVAGPFDFNADGVIDPLTDGVMALRYIIGYTNAWLIDGLVGISSQRFTASDIQTHLNNTLTPSFDPDGDGQTLLATDGVLFLRYVAGLVGSALVNGAVNQEGERTDSDVIVAWFDSLQKEAQEAVNAASAQIDRAAALGSATIATSVTTSTGSSIPASPSSISTAVAVESEASPVRQFQALAPALATSAVESPAMSRPSNTFPAPRGRTRTLPDVWVIDEVFRDLANLPISAFVR